MTEWTFNLHFVEHTPYSIQVRAPDVFGAMRAGWRCARLEVAKKREIVAMNVAQY